VVRIVVACRKRKHSRSSNGRPTEESEFVLLNDELKWPLNLGPVDSYVRCQQPGNKLSSLATGFASDQLHRAGDEASDDRLIRLLSAGWITPHRPLFVLGFPTSN
jgi:hypothetical protein